MAIVNFMPCGGGKGAIDLSQVYLIKLRVERSDADQQPKKFSFMVPSERTVNFNQTNGSYSVGSSSYLAKPNVIYTLSIVPFKPTSTTQLYIKGVLEGSDGTIIDPLSTPMPFNTNIATIEVTQQAV